MINARRARLEIQRKEFDDNERKSLDMFKFEADKHLTEQKKLDAFFKLEVSAGELWNALQNLLQGKSAEKREKLRKIAYDVQLNDLEFKQMLENQKAYADMQLQWAREQQQRTAAGK